MAHRDDVDALRARIEAQERDLRDAKAELDVLQAAARANAAAAHDQAENPSAFGAMGFGPGFGPDPSAAGPSCGANGMSPLRAETQRRVGLLVLLITTLVAGLFLSTTNCPSSRRRAYAHPPLTGSGAVPLSGPDGFAPFVRFARVVDPGTPAAVPMGQACAVEVTPVNSTGFDCRVVIRCDDQVLYGERPDTGFNVCGPVPSRIVDGDVSRDDGDPAMLLDLASGHVVIEERVGLGTQRVELQLE